MTMHRYHPLLTEADIEKAIGWGLVPAGFPGDPEKAVLYDSCERCDEHTRNPHWNLDARNLSMLSSMTPAQARTDNERKAIERLADR